MAFAETHGIPVPSNPDRPYSIDQNLLHISYEGGILENPWNEAPGDIYTITVSPREAPDEPEVIDITFREGDPVAIDEKPLSAADMLAELNSVGGKHGVGRADIVENRFVGMKSRGIYETPGGTILRKAHRAMESITMDREVMHLRDSLTPKYSELIYNGFWFSPEMKILQRMIDDTQKNVSGVVRVELYKGNCRVLRRKSDMSLYREDFATFEDDSVYRQKDAEGFIRLNALRLRILKMLET
jgi:argininosuccinate synthase